MTATAKIIYLATSTGYATTAPAVFQGVRKRITSVASNNQESMRTPDYLAAARAAARWMVSRQCERHWLSRPDEPPEELLDLYYGTAGTILFFRELAESTGEQSYRD